MKSSRVRACLLGALSCSALCAAGLPLQHLDAKTLDAFSAYIANYEQKVVKPYVQTGKLWIDTVNLSSGKPVLEAHENGDVASGSLHAFTGGIRVAQGTVEDMRAIMKDYPNYPKYFKPDVIKAVGELKPDTTPNDEHFIARLTLAESTLWFNVGFECVYDTHYIRDDATHLRSRSFSTSLKEMRDAKDPAAGMFPEGEDHGFMWRTNTYWYAREVPGGLDLQVDSITLSRPNVTGFGWFGSKRSREAVEKMLRDAKTAIQARH